MFVSVSSVAKEPEHSATIHIINTRWKVTYLKAGIAQLVEQQTFMQQVPGSIPAPDSSWLGVDSALHPSVGRLN